ncbi:MAG TPA: hypothetical protein VFT41_03305 [Gemmatimonadaceae bacterium]|nr:hypothetical protein [Gemmatimonadaceae bacterium]
MTSKQALTAARQQFIAAINRDTTPTECPRFLAVLDAFIEWSLARPTLVKFNAEESHDGIVTFSRVSTKARPVALWAATPRGREMPRMELLPRAARLLPEEERAAVTTTLNAYSRDELAPGDPLRITFGALKNRTARAAMFDCMDRLLVVT